VKHQKGFFKTYGYIPEITELNIDDDKGWIVVHPDMQDENIFKNEFIKLYESSDIKLVPTASGRTLMLINSSVKGYFKVHYSGIIGRIKRDLTHKKSNFWTRNFRIIYKSDKSKKIRQKVNSPSRNRFKNFYK